VSVTPCILADSVQWFIIITIIIVVVVVIIIIIIVKLIYNAPKQKESCILYANVCGTGANNPLIR